MPNDIPADVRKQLEASGISFGDDGQIIEDSFTSGFSKPKKKAKPIVQVEKDEDEDEDDDDTDQEDSNDSDDDSLEDDTDQEDQDQDEAEDEDEDEDEAPVRKKKSITLTPRKEDDEVKEDKVTSETLKAMQLEMIERIDALSKDNEGKPDDEESPSIKELRAEAQKFQKMRIQMFAKEVEQEVNSLNLGAKFKDIITSQEWRDYLNSNILGTTIGTLYVDSVKENDSESVVGFFGDFIGRFLPSVARSKKVSKTVKETLATNIAKSKDKPSLDDLSVPNRSKTTNSPRKASKYDYKESDYDVMLNNAERGKITYKEFNEFDTKFNTALSRGRVDTNS